MFDLILKGGTVIDGTRKPAYKANICIQDGKIARITPEDLTDAREVLDVTGLTVAPGFIDPHSHADVAHFSDYPVESQLAQGVTTELCGNCGASIIPATDAHMEDLTDYIGSKANTAGPFHSISDYVRAGNAHGSCINHSILVGHSNLRVAIMGHVNRDPSAEEMEQLKALLEQEMQRGAFGMSLGLIYPPSAFSSREELVELAKVIAKYDGILAVHMRNEGPRLFEAVEEMLDIAKRSGVHLQISHLKLMGKPQWGKSDRLLKLLDSARAQGIHVTCDQYPFLASSTNLSALVPHWAHEGGNKMLTQRLAEDDGTILADIQTEMENRGGADAVLIINTRTRYPQWEGKTLAQLAPELGMTPAEVARKILILCEGYTGCVYFSMNQEDMLAIMKKLYICVGSDGGSLSHDPRYTPYVPHPRYYCAFTRFFQTIREHGLMSLEDAVYKVTALPASILGIHDRGILKEGLAADIAVFDPAAIGSEATFLESRIRPTGVPHVIVNGRIALRDGVSTHAQAGATICKI